MLTRLRNRDRRTNSPVKRKPGSLSALLVMELIALSVVVIVMTLRLTSSGDDDTCDARPMFSTKEQSADFFGKSSWAGHGWMMYEEEGAFVRRRQCPLRVRVDEEGHPVKNPSLSNESRSKDPGTSGSDSSATKKNNNSHRKLKGSKRKRKKEKRKRLRKKKKKTNS